VRCSGFANEADQSILPTQPFVQTRMLNPESLDLEAPDSPRYA